MILKGDVFRYQIAPTDMARYLVVRQIADGVAKCDRYLDEALTRQDDRVMHASVLSMAPPVFSWVRAIDE